MGDDPVGLPRPRMPAALIALFPLGGMCRDVSVVAQLAGGHDSHQRSPFRVQSRLFAGSVNNLVGETIMTVDS